MKNISLSLFAILGISLFSYDTSPYDLTSFIPFTLSLADFVVFILLLYCLFEYKKISINSISFTFILLIISLTISGVYNLMTFDGFQFTSFFLNLIRTAGIVGMLLLLPSLLREIGDIRIGKLTMWVIRFHCVFLFFDAYSIIPIEWFPADVPGISRSVRPAGLFMEPGWFGVWVGLAFFSVLQIEKNNKIQLISVLDIMLIIIAIVTSTGIRGVLFIGIGMIIMLFFMGIKSSLRTIKSLILISVIALVGGGISPSSFIDGHGYQINSSDYVSERLANILTSEIKDGSSLDRLDSTTVAISYTYENSPILGIGLGGDNWDLRLPDYSEIYGKSGSSLMFTSVFVSGGLIGLILFLFIGIRILTISKTRIIGLGLGIAAIIWGGVFEVFIWWYVVLAVSLISEPRIQNNNRN